MPLSPGDKLGPYEILAPIGAGGMGEVYKARDARLDRLVAIKILPHDKTGDEERKRRFVQEAKAASALNHPNIVTIFDIGSENGIDFLVMELVPGKSLDQLIPRTGMRLSEILRAAVQIADAFSQAHAAGIVHRDLKPANVMVTPESQVKILDFGLAKLTQSAPSESDATRTIAAHTGQGAVLGTTAYMSPEQAEGKPVDGRSDIFAFGSLLYEMSTGQRAFRGDTQMSTISAILRDDPKPASEWRDDIPAQFARVITRCLRKDPARRFQHMADLRVELEELKEESDSGKLGAAIPAASHSDARPSRSKLSRTLLWTGAAVLCIVAGVAGARLLTDKPAADAPLQAIPLTSYTGAADDPSFSPDGTQVAFSWDGEKEDNRDIYVKLIGPGAPLRLTTDPAQDGFPSWAPDGRSIAFQRSVSRGELAVMTVPPLGGPERKLAQFFVPPHFSYIPGLCWTPDSKSIIVGGADQPNQPTRLYAISIETGERKPLTNPPAQINGDGAPALSPDGRTLAFWREKSLDVGNLLMLDLGRDFAPAAEPRQITIPGVYPTRQPIWPADGRDILFESGNRTASRLYRAAASGGSPPRTLDWAGTGITAAAVSAAGHRLVFGTNVQNSNIYRAPLGGKGPVEKFISSTFRESFPQYSPDGKRLTFYSNRTGTTQIWTSAADGSGAQQLTSMNAPITGSPRWSPDGKTIAFDSNSGGNWQIYKIDAEGGKPLQITNDAYTNVTTNWSHDGHWIYYSSRRSGAQEVWKIPAEGGASVQLTRNGGGLPFESPDGKWLYFVKDDGAAGLWKMPVDGGPETRVLEKVHRANFVVLDRGIYFTPPRGSNGESAVQFLDFATGATKTILPIDKTIDLGFTVSPDGHYVLWSQIDHRGSNLMLVENFR
jgi:eukaryotic-like serine/threonine-protein kinase